MNLGVISAILVIAPSAVIAAPPEKPLYDLFQKLCVETRANPELIRKALKVSDLRPHERGAPTLSIPGMQLSGTVWDFVIGTRKFTLNATHGTEPYGRAMVEESDACSVTSWGEDKASLVALNEWLGRKGDPGALARLNFTFDGSKLAPLTDDASTKAATEHGKAWTATITNFGNGGSAMLLHLGVPYPRP